MRFPSRQSDNGGHLAIALMAALGISAMGGFGSNRYCHADPVSDDAIASVRDAQIEFALRMQSSQSTSTENVLCSPYDLFLTLTMLDFAAQGATQQELQKLTGRAGNASEFTAALKQLASSTLPSRPDLGIDVSDNDGYGVKIDRVDAWQSAFQEGDLVFTADDEVIRTRQQLAELVSTSIDQMQLTGYSREAGRHFDRTVELRRRAEAQANVQQRPLVVATGLWARSGLNVASPYAELIGQHYNAKLFATDFGDQQSFEQQANDFFEARLPGRMASRYPAPEFSNRTAFVVTNVVDFRREWELPFDGKRTVKGEFASFEERLRVSYMRQRDWFGYSKSDRFSTIRLPYVDSSLSMLLVMPSSADDFESVQREFLTDKSRLLAAINAEPSEVDVAIPRFSIRQEQSTKTALQEMGIRTLFNRSADLSGMFGKQKQPIWLDDIYQQIRLEVNEQGTQAGSQTTAVGVSLSASKVATFHARRPFLFFVHDTDGVVFFSGRVAKPTAAR